MRAGRCGELVAGESGVAKEKDKSTPMPEEASGITTNVRDIAYKFHKIPDESKIR